MTNILINKEFLERNNACKDGKEWWLRNGLENFPLNRLNEIEGDYKDYIHWLKTLPLCEYDSRDNLIKETDPDGSIWTYEYDSQNNLIKHF